MGTKIWKDPLQQLLWRTYIDQGFLKQYDVGDLMGHMMFMGPQDVLKELNRLGVRPQAVKKAGGMIERHPYPYESRAI